RGGFNVTFLGLGNYQKLLAGTEQRHFLGKLGEPSLAQWALLAAFLAVMLWMLTQYARSPGWRIFGLVMRTLAIALAVGLFALTVFTLAEGGLPGTLVVTLIFVFTGVFFQYLIGLGLALLVTQNLRGKRFFRVVFLMPMMITPVGIGFLFRMMVDTGKGPFAPIWNFLGLQSISWVDTPSGARAAVMIGDIWQWTPFMFIILLAALEGTSREQIEAALVDGANRWKMFRYIILPQIAPVSITVILIRIIEGFKIIDMAQILTGGGPGTATESMTLYAYNAWRTQDFGVSSAIGYILLFIVTFIAMVIVNIIRPRVVERL
ncbi:MAG: sugar ABC transporter permease, partial [Burkholderiales bacterium]|nr:sugar ABC transporter permease [Anaerolineae bacterium]